MLTIQQLLDAAKRGAGIPSNYRLARVLGVSDNTINRWQHGRVMPSDTMAAQLADMAGLDADSVVAAMHAQRATDADERARWARIAQRLQAAAAAVFLSLGVVASPDAAASVGAGVVGCVCRSVRILCKAAIAALRRLPLLGAPELPASFAPAGR